MRKQANGSNQTYDAIYRSPVAPLGITMQGYRLAAMDWLLEAVPAPLTPSKAVTQVVRSLDQYFADSRSTSTITFNLIGTAFQQRVWQALQTIPSGEVMTYGQLARRLKTCAQAIGQACRTNPIAVLIPCHRVIAAQGLGGYMGEQRQTRIKKWLLRHEGVTWL
ncbi:MAG: ogt [Gammaproteobacteria bacterium]|nr:ogt [Gammaproteobacteria bacterium]